MGLVDLKDVKAKMASKFGPDNFEYTIPKNPLPAPKVNVSPLIRGARWVALLAGIYYGANRYAFLAEREVGIKAHEDKIKADYAAKKELEKQAFNEAEMAALGKEAGIAAK